MFTGGILKSSKLSQTEYFRLLLKKKLSLIIYSLLFSTVSAPLKNSSLDARKGLKLKLVLVLNFETSCLAKINFALFSYMIGNTDWSLAYQHNVEMFFDGRRLVAVPYDFDHSGLVDAFYAKPAPQLKISSVTERVYRGLCKRDADTFTSIRNLYRSKEDDISTVLDSFKDKISEKEFIRITKYIESFYDIIKSDIEFNNKILSKCRG